MNGATSVAEVSAKFHVAYWIIPTFQLWLFVLTAILYAFRGLLAVMPISKFVPRTRKQKARARAAVPAQVQLNGIDNSNATEIIPTSKSEAEERRKKLREEIRAQQPESKFSSRKRKRLDHYIVRVLLCISIVLKKSNRSCVDHLMVAQSLTRVAIARIRSLERKRIWNSSRNWRIRRLIQVYSGAAKSLAEEMRAGKND